MQEEDIIYAHRIDKSNQKNMTTISVSLTRAHKIAERLKTQASQLMSEATAAASAARIASVPGESQLARLKAQGASAVELSSKAARFLRACATVRAIISRENEARGIGAKLAKLDAVNKLAAHSKELLETAKGGQLELNELAEYKPLANESAYASMTTVNVVDAANRASIQEEAARLQREAMQLSDEIAEANAARLSFELDDDLAAFATGAG